MSDNKKYDDSFFEQFNNMYSENKNAVNTKVSKKSGTFNKFNRFIKDGKKPLFVFAILLIIIVLIITMCIKGCSDSKKETVSKASATSSVEKKENKEKVLKYAKRTDSTTQLGDSINAQNAILINTKNMTIVAERGGDSVVYPASMTKVFTVSLACDIIDNSDSLSYDDTFTMTTEIIDPLYRQQATMAGFKNGEQVKVIDLMYGTLLPSGAEAAVGLATYIAGSEENYVNLMNERLKELGLKNTHFTNVVGLHDQNHYTTPHEMALLTKFAYDNENCRKVLCAENYTTSATEQNPEGVKLQSDMFKRMYGTEPEGATVIGGKTGYTAESGNCLTSVAKGEKSGDIYILVTCRGNGKYKSIYDCIDIYSAYSK